MSRFLKSCACLAAFLLSFQSARAFSLLGPVNEAYQVPEIGYNLPGDIGAPKNLHEEYRWNTPFTYYAFDPSFLDYFGSNGIREIEKAVGILNALTNHPYSALNPDDWPLESLRVNTRAQALQLLDLKSVALNVMVEELGLAEPDRWVWTLRDRRTQPGLSCPFMIYDVIRRNFDPITHQYSTYINGVLFSYLISEICSGPNPLAVTLNFPVDPTAQDFTPVASSGIFTYGAFFTGLTRDDVGGLRYLMRTNNVNWEQPSDDSVFYATNTSQVQFLVTSNLSILQAAARTNDAAALTALFPGLNILATSNSFRFAWVTNVTPYFTNYPWDSPDPLTGTLIPHVVFATNRTWTVETIYIHTFGNLLTFRDTPNGLPEPVQLLRLPPPNDIAPVTLQTVVVTNFTWSPFGITPITNYYFQSYFTNRAVGEYFILPTNACDIKLLSRLGPIVTTFYTNQILSVTNTNTVIIITNQPGNTNGFGQIDQFLIESARTRVFAYYPVECVSSNSMLRQGMDRIHFIRTDYDSLLGRFYKPITNNYTLMAVTNSVIITNYFQRVAVAPDWIFQAFDGLRGAVFRSTPDYTTNNAIPGLAGPGTIQPNVSITFNKVGPLNINVYGGTNAVLGGLHELGSITNFIWGSYDGSTNTPIIYPQDVRVDDIEPLIYYQVTTSELPQATVGVPYSFQLQVFGGRIPHTWAPAFTSAPLPLDLSLGPGGLISGTPEEPGTFNFTVDVTDAEGRIASRTLTIIVNP